MLNAAQMALFDIGYADFQLLPHDTQDSPQIAAQAATDAIHEGAQLILGPVFAEDVTAVKPIAAAANINVIAFSTDWRLAGDNVFIMGFLPFDQVKRVIDYASAHNVKNLAMIDPTSDYSHAITPSYQSAIKDDNLASQSITVRQGDAASLQAVKKFAQNQANAANGIDAAFLPMSGSLAASTSYALTVGGLTPQRTHRLGTGLFDDDALAANPALDGAWFAAPAPRQRKNFEQRYLQTYGSAPPRLSTLAYDATALASTLAQRVHNASAFNRDAITNPNGFAGLDGIFRFRQNGMAERGLAILQYSNGHISVLEDSPATFQQTP